MTPNEAMRFITSHLQLTGPLLIFDLETTGLSRTKDRIVQIAYLQVEPDGTIERRNLLVDPRKPISRFASAVHGITEGKVAGLPPFRRYARNVRQRFRRAAVIAGFNIRTFDVPFLAAELERSGKPIDVSSLVSIDAMRIFHDRESLPSRKLEDALQFYCGADHAGAHDAGADVDATAQVLAAQLERYPELAQALSIRA